jgi:hypothetical protein
MKFITDQAMNKGEGILSFRYLLSLHLRLNLILIALPVGGSLGHVRGPLFIVQGLPELTQNLADLTEPNARILVSDVLALLIGKEHIGGQTALGGIGV